MTSRAAPRTNPAGPWELRTGRWAYRQVLRTAVVVGLAACSEPSVAPFAGRTVVAERWDTLWAYHSSLEDSLLLGFRAIEVDDERAYVLSEHPPHILAFSLQSGEPLWSAGERGEGPDEFRNPIDLQLSDDGELVVLDGRLRKLVFLGSDGSFEKSVPMTTVRRPQRFCSLRGGRWLIKTWHTDAPLIAIGPDGNEIGRAQLPWSDSVAMISLMQAGEVAHLPGREACVLAMSFGRGWMIVGPKGAIGDPHAYVEDFDLPGAILTYRVPGAPPDEGRVDDTYAASAVDVVGDTLIVSFVGVTSAAWQWFDFYDLREGAYLYSYRYPPHVGIFTHRSGTFYVRGSRAGYPSLLAIRPRISAAESRP